MFVRIDSFKMNENAKQFVTKKYSSNKSKIQIFLCNNFVKLCIVRSTVRRRGETKLRPASAGRSLNVTFAYV